MKTEPTYKANIHIYHIIAMVVSVNIEFKESIKMKHVSMKS
jgi:hypothetical protein